MKKIMTIVTVLAMAAVASAGTVDNFNSYTDGNLVPQGSWVPYYMGGSPEPSVSVLPAAGGDGSKAIGGENAMGAAMLDPADVPSDGTFVLETLLNMNANGHATLVTVHLGTGMYPSPVDTRDEVIITFLGSFAAFPGEVTLTRYKTVGDYTWETTGIDLNLDELGWFKVEIESTLVSDALTAVRFRTIDVVDATYAETGAWSAYTDVPFGTAAPVLPALDWVAVKARAPINSGPEGDPPNEDWPLEGLIDNFGPIGDPPPPVLGDVDGDWRTGPVDATIILGNAGMSGTYGVDIFRTDGDLDADGDVDADDLQRVEDNWGGGYPLEPPAEPTATPEPGTLLVLLAGAAAGLIRRR